MINTQIATDNKGPAPMNYNRFWVALVVIACYKLNFTRWKDTAKEMIQFIEVMSG